MGISNGLVKYMPGNLKVLAHPYRFALSVLSILIIVAFFLPWVKLFGRGFAGYELAQLSRHLVWLWLIPITALGNALVCLVCQHCRPIFLTGCVAGSVPLIAFLYLLYSTSIEVFRILSVGAYLSVFASGALLWCAAYYWVSGRRVLLQKSLEPGSSDNN